MESGSTSYCVYAPGNMSPSRPPLRRAAPEHARSGWAFLIGMAALVMAVGIGSVARFCPQDLRFESGGKHPAKSTTTTAAAITADPKTAESAPVITPTTFTTVGAPAAAAAPTVIVASTTAPTTAPTTTTAKKTRTTPRARGAASSAPAGSASASPALPDNPYPEASSPDTYGF